MLIVANLNTERIDPEKQELTYVIMNINTALHMRGDACCNKEVRMERYNPRYDVGCHHPRDWTSKAGNRY